MTKTNKYTINRLRYYRLRYNEHLKNKTKIVKYKNTELQSIKK